MNAPGLPDGVAVTGPAVPGADRILTPEALTFVADLQRRFGPLRLDLLKRREERQAELDAGVRPDFLLATAHVRDEDWIVAPAPADLDDRRVEITGPAEPKMMINALNSGARVFMADLEDALSPTWTNVIEGQAAIADATRGTLAFDSPEGKAYRLNDDRPRSSSGRAAGTSIESHVLVDGVPALGVAVRLRAVPLPLGRRPRSRRGAGRTCTCRSSSRTTRPASGTTTPAATVRPSARTARWVALPSGFDVRHRTNSPRPARARGPPPGRAIRSRGTARRSARRPPAGEPVAQERVGVCVHGRADVAALGVGDHERVPPPAPRPAPPPAPRTRRSRSARRTRPAA